MLVCCTVKPEFRNKEAGVVIVAGESRVLDLTAVANPSNCTYQLKKGTEIINPGATLSMEEGKLTISAITKTDGGSFTIIAINSEGMANFDFTIDVHCKLCMQLCFCLSLCHLCYLMKGNKTQYYPIWGFCLVQSLLPAFKKQSCWKFVQTF